MIKIVFVSALALVAACSSSSAGPGGTAGAGGAGGVDGISRGRQAATDGGPVMDAKRAPDTFTPDTLAFSPPDTGAIVDALPPDLRVLIPDSSPALPDAMVPDAQVAPDLIPVQPDSSIRSPDMQPAVVISDCQWYQAQSGATYSAFGMSVAAKCGSAAFKYGIGTIGCYTGCAVQSIFAGGEVSRITPPGQTLTLPAAGFCRAHLDDGPRDLPVEIACLRDAELCAKMCQQ